MSDQSRNDELKGLRRELDDVRAEFEAHKKSIVLHRFRGSSDSTDFPGLFQEKIAGELRRRSTFARIERRVSALEKRLTEIEATERSEALN